MKLKAALLAVALSAGAVQSGFAADMPMKASPAPAAVVAQNWTGLYVGVNAGGAWGKSTFVYIEDVPPPDVGHNIGGGLVGGTVGYNLQFANWVIGVEGDWDYARLRGSHDCPNSSFRCETRVDWLATARGRLGYAWGPWLAFVTGGGAWQRTELAAVHKLGNSIPPSGGPENGSSRTRSGWTAGAGLEWAFTRNLSAKIEYLYASFGEASYVIDNGIVVASKQHESILRVGVNYRFGAI